MPSFYQQYTRTAMVVDFSCSDDSAVADLAILLPDYLTEEIFSSLDVCSLCRSSQVCRSWHSLITESIHIWRNMYHSLNGGSQKYPMTAKQWKDMVRQMHKTQRCKAKWLKGKFSHINSYMELRQSNSFCEFSKEDWGDILQFELTR